MFICYFITLCLVSLGINIVTMFLYDMNPIIFLVFSVFEFFFRMVIAFFYFYAIIYYCIMFEKFFQVLFEDNRCGAWLCRLLVFSMSLSEVAENFITHGIHIYRLSILNIPSTNDCSNFSIKVFVYLQYLIQANTLWNSLFIPISILYLTIHMFQDCEEDTAGGPKDGHLESFVNT